MNRREKADKTDLQANRVRAIPVSSVSLRFGIGSKD
jgi:hypothetical protein